MHTLALARRHSLPALVLSAFAVATSACGGTTVEGTPVFDAGPTPDGATAIDGGSTPDGSVPTPDAGPQPQNGGAFAMSKLYIGDTDRNGVVSQTAWKQFGRNIDGKVTDKNSTDVCTLASGASKSTQTDGVNGTDNSWGENILPIWLTVGGTDFGTKMNATITAGQFTMMVRLATFGSQQDVPMLPGSFYTGAPLQSPPLWNGLDVWPVLSTSVMGGDVDKPLVTFASGAMTSRMWTSGTPTSMSLPFDFGGINAIIPLTNARIDMLVSADGSSVGNGTISGVIPTEDYITQLKLVAGRISTSLCQGSAFDSIAQQIRQASDIKMDGTNSAGPACDGISFAWGFDAKTVQLGAVAAPVTPSPDPCSP